MSRRDRNQAVIQQLAEEARQRLSPAEAEPVAAFADEFLESFPFEEFPDRSPADLFAYTLGSWHFLKTADELPKVRVFNPAFEQHGWAISHTLVAVLCATPAFALNSVRAELNRRNITIFTIHSSSIHLRREDGCLQAFVPRAQAGSGESLENLLYLEIERQVGDEAIAELARTLHDILVEVRVVVADFEPMVDRLRQAQRSLAEQAGGDAAARDEVIAFIDWMLDDNFTFLGAERLKVEVAAEGVPTIRQMPAQQLGLLRQRGSFGVADLHAELASAQPDETLAAVQFSKSSVRARVHRRVYPDYVLFRLRDSQGRLVAEERFLGLYASRAYTVAPTQIPIIRRKVAGIMARAGYAPGSHEYAELTRVLEVHPRDELFQSSVDALFPIVSGIHALQERRLVRLFVQRDARHKFVSCLVYMPRDIYRTELRRKVESILCDAFAAQESEFSTFFSESVLTRTHFILRVDPLRSDDVDLHQLEHQVIQATLGWQDHLRNHLIEEFGEARGIALARQYDEAFPPGYRDDWDPRAAVSDIRHMAWLARETDIAMHFHRVVGDPPDMLQFRLFHLGQPLPLSDVMPILENLGLRVISERPYGINRGEGGMVWIHEFGLTHAQAASIDVSEVGPKFQEAFARVWSGEAESDSFNKLILAAGLSWRESALLRAYARYMKQIQVLFSIDFIAETLTRQYGIARLLVDLFLARFDPQRQAPNPSGSTAAADPEFEEVPEADIETRIVEALQSVDNLSEDRIVRQYVALMQASVRTNYFQTDQAGRSKPYLAIKLCPQQLPQVPEPRPQYEVYVYSPRVEGVHLRTSKVARGGLRWSDRHEDFRTEILGLVKAQQVKNAVIVPSGAKGGFVSRYTRPGMTREQVQEEGIACYRWFISALLDITDNLKGAEIIPPVDVRRRDDDDPYLVVAADKGTASFSDIANEIALSYGFWLGDAFASGGSVGYDHKKMGITARGAWVSVERHMRQLGIDPAAEDFTVVGIGDMAGDVFGNGMLCSRHIRLLAAFNHQHIFIDPDPDPLIGYAERERLFNLPRSSWADYDTNLLSPGGGVFPRSLKSIEISAEMRRCFGIEAQRLAPADLIAALLKAPVDLLWNGGIGTYIKASNESHAEVGDKANDNLRVDGRELRCRVVAEGGNLGATQRGRIEYALNGGLCNTDFIDNSGGVDCSDYEVNIKIALNPLVQEGDMTEKQRRQLLQSMTEEVAGLVLADNYRQALALSLAERQALERHGEYRRLIHRMEAAGHLNRALEFLPDDETMAQRKAEGRALTRPELAVLMAYTKNILQGELLASDAPDDALLAHALYEGFPRVLCESYRSALDEHRLGREIVATRVANDMVDVMGIAFVERIVQSTGALVPEAARAYVTAREVYAIRDYWQLIAGLDGRVAADVQLDMMLTLMRLARRATRWFIRNRRRSLDPAREVEHFRDALAGLFHDLPRLLQGRLREQYDEAIAELVAADVPDQVAAFVAAANFLYAALGLVDAASQRDLPLNKVFEVHQRLVLELELDAFARRIAELKVDNHWQALARESYRDDFESQARTLAVSALDCLAEEGDPAACVARWLDAQSALVTRWRELVAELNASDLHDFAVYAVALRELLDLAQSSRMNHAAGAASETE